MKKLLLACICLCMCGCTENARTKTFGGETTYHLSPNEKLVNVTWKQANNIWVLTKKMNPADKPEIYTFKEKSNFGIMEGTITIIETK